MDENTKKSNFKSKYLIKRFLGTLVDKVFICVLATFTVFFIYFFYRGIAGNIGVFSALFHMNTHEVYLTAVGNVMGNYHGDWVSQHEKEISDCLSYYKQLEATMLLLFASFNIVYYFISETICRVSFGKAFFKFILVNSKTGKKISVIYIMFRVVVFSLLILLMFLFRWTIGVNYYVVVVVYILAMDIPVFLKKRSLLDILTNTKLIFEYQQKENIETGIKREMKMENKYQERTSDMEDLDIKRVCREKKTSKTVKYFFIYCLICSLVNISLAVNYYIKNTKQYFHHYDIFGIRFEDYDFPLFAVLLVVTFLIMNIPALFVFCKAAKQKYSWDYMLQGSVKNIVYKLAVSKSEVRAFVSLVCYPFFIIGQLPFGIVLLCYIVPLFIILSIVLIVRWIIAGGPTENKVESDGLFKDYYLILDLQKDATQDEISMAYNRALAILNSSPSPKSSMFDLQEAYKVLSSEKRLRPAYDREYMEYDQQENLTPYHIKDKKLKRDIDIVRRSIGINKEKKKSIKVNVVLLSFILLIISAFFLFSCVTETDYRTKDYRKGVKKGYRKKGSRKKSGLKKTYSLRITKYVIADYYSESLVSAYASHMLADEYWVTESENTRGRNC